MNEPPAASLADLELALELAKDVAPLALDWYTSQDLDVITKADGSPVTQADTQVEQRLRELIDTHDKDAAILGEEEGATAGTSKRQWILDPIDGTSAFARGVPLWSTLIALHDEHGPAVGIISLPAINEVVYAARGLGAFHNDKACRVSDTSNLKDAYVTTWGYDEWSVGMFERVSDTGAAMRGWSDAYGWFLLATGRVDVVIDPTTKIWDVAPMQTIIPEAGGALHTTPADASHSFTSIGTNLHLRDQVIDLLADTQ